MMVSFIGGGENLLYVTDSLYHIILHRVHLSCARFQLTTLVVIDTDCIGSCKSNYHTTTTTTWVILIKTRMKCSLDNLLSKWYRNPDLHQRWPMLVKLEISWNYQYRLMPPVFEGELTFKIIIALCRSCRLLQWIGWLVYDV